ncbi:hypothetical protein EMPS_08067 [Entomortierella parvispora]|uniref:Cytochrome P450 n=1 Tax=Entomortierella parvispora TaxID=205924 RepID=A0A9P3HFD1_9FUNG|nr:hypothetical protein EMPS_08067 [Entomortierella parvispora]
MTTATSSSTQLATLIRALKPIFTRRSLAKIVGAYLLVLIFRYRDTPLGVQRRPDLKGPWALPLLGNLYQIISLPRNEVLQRQTLNHEKFGSVYAMTIPGVGRIINIIDPDMVDHVLRVNFWAYEKGSHMRTMLGPLVGQGIFGADGEHWKWQRKLASHIFNVKAFRTYTSNVFCQEGQHVVDYLSSVADTGEVVDLQELFYKFTLESFGEIAFGESFGCLKDPKKEVPFAQAFDRLNHALSERFISPIWKLVEWRTGRGKQVEKDTQLIYDFAYRVIRKRREEGFQSDNKNLMQLFMEAHDETGEPLSDEMLKDTCLNFIIAGRDTTAQALAWCFYLMHRTGADPAVFQNLTEETDRILQGGYPSYESVKQQKYAEACFHETLRLYPSVPKNIKVCVQDDVLPGGVKVHRGEKIGWSSWAMGRNVGIWGADAKEFNPERWLNGEKPSQSKFVSFHLGPRTCLGQQFATIEAITLMSMLAQKFTFQLIEPDKEPAYLPSLTLPMQTGLPVRVYRR